jgi:hypothetical protein
MEDYYWATEEDLDKLVGECQDRIKAYGEYVRESRLWARVIRNYKYYHNLYFSHAGDFAHMEIKALGEQGELAGLSVNHFRNFMQHLLSLVTQQKPTFAVKAINTEQESLDAARKGDSILEYYLDERRIDKNIDRALEHCLIFLTGYVLSEWDGSLGREVQAYQDPETEEYKTIKEGDVKISNPTIFDVVHDLSCRVWDENQWFLIRNYENKWDLLERYPDLEDQIRLHDDEETDSWDWEFERAGIRFKHSDRVSCWTLWHESTDALPGGRLFKFLGTQLPLIDAGLPYRATTLRRIVPGEALMTCMGYSPANDLQGLQEAYNGETSSILSNHKSFGVQNIWVQSGDNVSEQKLQGGLNLMRSRTEPKGLNLTETPGEIFQFRNDLLQDMEYISGVNSVARGQPEASLKSGTALALIDAKAVQFATPLVKAYNQLIEDVGSDILWILNNFIEEGSERIIAITGKYQRPSEVKMRKGNLDRIDRVIVKSGNPLAKTTSGRMEIANLFITSGLIRLPEELINVLETGQIESLLEAERSQLEIVRDENEAMLDLMRGEAEEVETIAALATDNHVMHVREHQVLLNSTEVRRNNQMASFVLSHIMQHITLMADPAVMMLQSALGFQLPLPPGPPQGAPQQAAEGVSQIMDVESEIPVRSPRTPATPQGANV